MRSNTKLISSLINRVAVRLPINSGRKLESLEQDPIVQQTVAAIIELSRYKLSTIANALGTVLENVSNNYQATSAVAIEQTIPFDILQSQLFILRLLSACMQHQWKCYRELSKERSIVAKTASLSLEAAAADAAIGIYNDSESPQITDEKSMAQSIDLPPLDEALVTFILVLMGRFLNQAHLVEEFIEQQQLNALEYPNEPLPHIEPTTANIVMDIYKAAGRVLYYVSASNWLTYYAKIKSVVQVLGAIKDLNELSPPEIRMLESSCLTRQRLQMVLSGKEEEEKKTILSITIVCLFACLYVC
ncbi:hypothetical protein J3Q64DRAFT_1447842 [Phycomyces blakesleeanus]|uniref:Uncharacterized protein n=1 Tax=Phycomyces blakesleeanus TaxID=4837 RepID=A0ABR3AGD2_PHYBL